MNRLDSPKNLRVAILQRVCPGYRACLFSELSKKRGLDLLLLIGLDMPNTKVKSAENLDGISYKKLKTRFLNFGGRVLPWHIGLVGELRKFGPDVILCEGESHFIGYLQAICYRWFFNRRVALMHWCYISLPGQPIGVGVLRSLVKRFFRIFFDAFVVYSSFSKECLLKLGQPSEKIFVATNVCNTQQFIKISNLMNESKPEARRKLSLPERFTVLYLGTLDKNKRPEIMLDLAKESNLANFNFVLLGSGTLLDELRERVVEERLSNVFLPGRLVDELPYYYRAADVLLIPGRGGIVISEAMAFGVPVIVHEADGTEYDLVQNDVTGFRLSQGSAKEFCKILEFLSSSPKQCEKMSLSCRELIEHHFTINNMVEQIISAAIFAKETRSISS